MMRLLNNNPIYPLLPPVFWKKLVHKCNKQGVESGKKSMKSINVEGGIFQNR